MSNFYLDDHRKFRVVYLIVCALLAVACYWLYYRKTWIVICDWMVLYFAIAFTFMVAQILSKNWMFGKSPRYGIALRETTRGFQRGLYYGGCAIGIIGVFSVSIIQLGYAVISFFEGDNLWAGFRAGGSMLLCTGLAFFAGSPMIDFKVQDEEADGISETLGALTGILFFFFSAYLTVPLFEHGLEGVLYESVF